MTNKLVLVLAFSLLVTASVLGQNSTSTGPTMTPVKSTMKSTRPPIFRPTKDQITQVQKILKDKKLYTGDASGSYNDDTRSGIKSFQKDNGLKETGTLNRATLEKFGVELTEGQKKIPVSPSSFATPKTDKTKTSTKSTSSTSTSKKTIFRATNDQIKAAQKLLKSKSMYSGEETGKLDDATRDGLKKFQDASGLKVTGTLNAATLDKMGIPLTDGQKASTTTEESKK